MLPSSMFARLFDVGGRQRDPHKLVHGRVKVLQSGNDDKERTLQQFIVRAVSPFMQDNEESSLRPDSCGQCYASEIDTCGLHKTGEADGSISGQSAAHGSLHASRQDRHKPPGRHRRICGEEGEA